MGVALRIDTLQSRQRIKNAIEKNTKFRRHRRCWMLLDAAGCVFLVGRNCWPTEWPVAATHLEFQISKKTINVRTYFYCYLLVISRLHLSHKFISQNSINIRLLAPIMSPLRFVNRFITQQIKFN